MDAARRREIEMETQARKRKAARETGSTAPEPKKMKNLDTRPGQSNGEHRTRESAKRQVTVKCYKCDQIGHFSRDCKMATKVCFRCNQAGHVKADCPGLRMDDGRDVPRIPAAPILRITDESTGRAGTEGTRGRIYQLTAEEDQLMPDSTTDM